MIRRNQILEIDVDEHGGLRSGATSYESPYADRGFVFLNLGRLSELFNSLLTNERPLDEFARSWRLALHEDTHAEDSRGDPQQSKRAAETPHD